jgi:TPR repeat protein
MTAAALVLIACASPAYADDFETGYAAYKQRDFETARRIWAPLAEQEVAAAQLAFGLLHYHGNGVARDPATAIEWISRSARQGFSSGQIVLATIYFEGDGMSRDMATAARWFRSAAGQGDTHAQNVLGTMYRDGLGVENNLVLAYMWFDISARGGHRQAPANRDAVAEKLPWRYLERARSLVRARLSEEAPPVR